jgi:hypothetical protein
MHTRPRRSRLDLVRVRLRVCVSVCVAAHAQRQLSAFLCAHTLLFVYSRARLYVRTNAYARYTSIRIYSKSDRERERERETV